MRKFIDDLGQFAKSLIRKGWARIPWYHKALYAVAALAMIVYAIGAVTELFV